MSAATNNKQGNNGDLTPWGIFGYILLFSIPVIGWILMIVFACLHSHAGRRDLARGFCLFVLFWIIVAVIVKLTGIGGPVVDWLNSTM